MTDALIKLLGGVREFGETAEDHIEPTDEAITEVQVTRIWLEGLEHRLEERRASR